MRKKMTKEQAGMAHGFRSGLEAKVQDQLDKLGIDGEYEENVILYVIPEKVHRYTADFRLPNNIIVETKGRFLTADRMKHLYIRKQQPELDIRFVFTNSKAKISKVSKTTYADWCVKYGFKFADKLIPSDWLTEIKS